MLFVSAKYIMPLKDRYLGICQGWTVSIAKSERIFQNLLDPTENLLNPGNSTHTDCHIKFKIGSYFSKIITVHPAGVVYADLICD